MATPCLQSMRPGASLTFQPVQPDWCSMKTEEIGAFEAKTKLSELLSNVQKGRIYFITKHGRRIAEVRPVAKRRPRAVFGKGKGSVVHMAPDFDRSLELFADYMK